MPVCDGGVQLLGRLGDQSRALRADCRKQFRMREGEAQCAVSAHGDSADGASPRGRSNAILAFDVRHEFLQEKIAVADRTVGGIDVKAAPPSGATIRKSPILCWLRRSSSIVHPPLLNSVCSLSPRPCRKYSTGYRGGFCCAGVVARGQVNAVVHRPLENAAVERAAIDAALAQAADAQTASRMSKQKRRKEAHASRLTRNATPAPDRAWRRAPQDTAPRPGSRRRQIRLQIPPATMALPRNVPAEGLALQINVRAEIDDLADGPAECHADDPAEDPMAPASAKNSFFTSPSLAPIAFMMPISRRRSRIAITSVLTMPMDATVKARLPKIPRNG